MSETNIEQPNPIKDAGLDLIELQDWDDEAFHAVLTPLVAFNQASLTQFGRTLGGNPLSHANVIYLLRKGGQTIGGYWGETNYGWLTTRLLVVPAFCRRLGIGTRLMHMAHLRAMELHCHAARLETFDFQRAEVFYNRLGYQCCAQLEDYPKGHCLKILRCELQKMP